MKNSGLISSRLLRGDTTLQDKLWQMSWSLVLLVVCLFGFGFAILYSAANGDVMLWAEPQFKRFVIGMVLMIGIAMIDIRILMRYAYIFYLAVLLLLILVEVRGVIGGGAQRWIDLGVISLQPSELMKPAVVLVLARYFHGLGLDEIGSPLSLLAPIAMVLLPVGMIIVQPDLGTALLIVMGSTAMFFVAGVRIWKFIVVGILGLAAVPVAWSFMHEYQRDRIRIFLNPEQDPLGAGYHIMQSKIALGSGGLFGKGFMEGTQSHLSFLPERQTDFIFTMLAEELGMVGGLALLGLYCLVVVHGYAIAFRCRHQFGRLVAMGITSTFFLYFFINIAMVMGLLPVVGLPLPLVSYGGTALLTLMLCIGLLLNVFVHRDVQMPARGGLSDF